MAFEWNTIEYLTIIWEFAVGDEALVTWRRLSARAIILARTYPCMRDGTRRRCLPRLGTVTTMICCHLHGACDGMVEGVARAALRARWRRRRGVPHRATDAAIVRGAAWITWSRSGATTRVGGYSRNSLCIAIACEERAGGLSVFRVFGTRKHGAACVKAA